MAKIRGGFVSNSSSSSFIISLDELTQKQISAIKNHTEYAKMKDWYNSSNEDNYCGISDPWVIYETDNTLEGNAICDNFDMQVFLSNLHVDNKLIKWGE